MCCVDVEIAPVISRCLTRREKDHACPRYLGRTREHCLLMPYQVHGSPRRFLQSTPQSPLATSGQARGAPDRALPGIRYSDSSHICLASWSCHCRFSTHHQVSWTLIGRWVGLGPSQSAWHRSVLRYPPVRQWKRVRRGEQGFFFFLFSLTTACTALFFVQFRLCVNLPGDLPGTPAPLFSSSTPPPLPQRSPSFSIYPHHILLTSRALSRFLQPTDFVGKVYLVPRVTEPVFEIHDRPGYLQPILDDSPFSGITDQPTLIRNLLQSTS